MPKEKGRPKKTPEQFDDNDVTLSGVVTKVWRRNGDTFARLASYDRRTRVVDPNGGKNGRPLRRAHYSTIRFDDGKCGEIEITLQKNDRVRVSGYIEEAEYSINLRSFLLKAKAAHLFEKDSIGLLANAEEIHQGRVATYVVANSFTNFGQ